MEQTLGKRIAEHRKRLGLTQDALAEQLGITAQAVSKWENDLSCPDITMLPKLAEIFGITTDELLGREAPEKVHEAQVVDPDEDDFEDSNNGWEFHWDSGKKHGITFAICILLVGVLTFAARWYNWDVSFWEILWPSTLLIYGMAGIFPRFSVFNLGMGLLGGYYLVENLGIWQFNLSGKLIFPICVVVFGIGLLFDALRKPKKPKFRIVKKGNHSNKSRVQCENYESTFNCNVSFGEATHIVSARRLEGGAASVSFGELRIDLSQVEEVAPNCVMDANCSFGEIVYKVPHKFRVECSNRTAFGNVDISGHPDPNPVGVIALNANASFGEVSVVYI